MAKNNKQKQPNLSEKFVSFDHEVSQRGLRIKRKTYRLSRNLKFDPELFLSKNIYFITHLKIKNATIGRSTLSVAEK